MQLFSSSVSYVNKCQSHPSAYSGQKQCSYFWFFSFFQAPHSRYWTSHSNHIIYITKTMFLCYYHLGLRQHFFPELLKYFLSGAPTLLSLLYKLISRMILSKFNTDHTIPLLLKIHFFSISLRMKAKIFTKAYRALNLMAPYYLYNLINSSPLPTPFQP